MKELITRQKEQSTQDVERTGRVLDQIDLLAIPRGVGDLIKMRAIAVLGAQRNGSFSMQTALSKAGCADEQEVNAALLQAVESTLEDPDTRARRIGDLSQGHVAITRYVVEEAIRFVAVETRAAQLLYEIPIAGIDHDGKIIKAVQLSAIPPELHRLEKSEATYTLQDRINPW